ncbi:MAG: putative porin [Candidatus Omnitrophota bacterium]|nr:putative porin [Candidatus Omnitrophota bacterium]
MRMCRIFVCAVTLAFIANIALAGEVDILVRKLVEKGILTPSEARQIIAETKEEAKKEAQQIIAATKEETKKEIAQGKYSSLPSWVQNTKLRGDFRLRYQYDHAKFLANSTTNKNGDQHRARIRMRLGIESKVNDKLLAGVGIATGKSDASGDAARSTDITLGGDGGFGKEPIALDYAFAQYSPTSWATLVGGKFKNPLWEPGDLIWDTDINPEGGAIKLSTTKLLLNTELFMNAGVLLVENKNNWSADPTLFAVQPGIVYNFNEKIKLKGAFSFYDFTDARGKVLSGSSGTNSGASTGLWYSYRNIIPAMELGIKEPLKFLRLDLPYFGLFGEYVQNVALQSNDNTSDDNTGYMLGFKFGTEKIEKWKDWQFRYNYVMLEKDAILDILPDSTRYSGKTGIRSHKVMFDWGLGKNTWLGFNYYYAWQLKGNFGSTQSKPATVAQVDWNLQF